MGTCKALFLAGAVVVGSAVVASAADLPPPPIVQPIADIGGWYLRGDVGVGIASGPDLRSSFDEGFVVPDAHFDQSNLGDAAFVDLGVGYAVNSWLRFDVTGEYRTSQTLHSVQSYDCSAFGCGDFNPNDTRAYDQYTGTVQSSVFLVNAYADLGTWYGLTPFVGAGVGASYNRVYGVTDTGVNGPFGFGVGGFGYAKQHDDTDFAWAAMAGLSYAVTPNVRLELGYRFLDMGTIKTGQIVCQNTDGCGHEVQKISLQSNDIRLGMRWLFSDIAPEPVVYTPPPPIVRKY